MSWYFSDLTGKLIVPDVDGRARLLFRSSSQVEAECSLEAIPTCKYRYRSSEV